MLTAINSLLRKRYKRIVRWVDADEIGTFHTKAQSRVIVHAAFHDMYGRGTELTVLMTVQWSTTVLYASVDLCTFVTQGVCANLAFRPLHFLAFQYLASSSCAIAATDS